MSGPQPALVSSTEDILERILSEVSEIKTCMNSRLTNLELKVSVLVQTCNKISMELAKNNEQLIESQNNINMKEKNMEVNSLDVGEQPAKHFSVIPLTKESDYPIGSWLGNPRNPVRRVRCPILPVNLTKINSICKSAPKMALCLTDHLFSKEDLACSNISGKSRFGKKQLNPLFIFSIKCHLEYKFSITAKDWQKICQNIDSKCRFIFRQIKAQKKLNKKKSLEAIKENKDCSNPETPEEINFYYDSIDHSGLDISSFKDISETACELRIVNATPSQINQLQQSHEIILEEILPNSDDSKMLIKNESMELTTDLRTGTTDSIDEHMDDT